MRKSTTEKVATLKNAGISTTRYFSLNLPEGLRPGSKVTLVVSDDGEPVFVPEETADDPIKAEIIKSGYINNNRLFRRWVMAHMMKALNYRSYWDGKTGFDAYMRDHHEYQYSFRMMLNEVHALAAMERTGGEDFEIRKSFFTKSVILDTCMDYLDKLTEYVNSREIRHCKGKPYVKIAGDNVFCEDIDDVIYQPVKHNLAWVALADNYRGIECALRKFISDMVKLPYETPKCKSWKDAFKGAGAYYTLQNLIRFHGVRVIVGGQKSSLSYSETLLEVKRREYDGEWWRLFAFMKKLIEDNKFDFNKRMKEIYGRK